VNRNATKYAAVLAVALLVLVAGCGGSSEPATPEKTGDAVAPPPPTPEEIAKRVATDLGLDAPLPPRAQRLPPSERSAIVSQFDQQQATLSKTPEGQAALEIIKRKTDDRIQALYGAEMWEHVVVYTDAYARLDPQSKKFGDMRAKAEIELRKPRVKVTGLPEVNGHQVAMLSFYIPLTSETHKETLSVGEEMHGIKFLGVFGENRGVRLEYLETGERYVALLSSAK
jgi:hypothetical protein